MSNYKGLFHYLISAKTGQGISSVALTSSTGRLTSDDTGYGVCGFNGQRILSQTHKESNPSFSALLCRFNYIFSCSLLSC
jgi:hypothetical protein